MSHASSLRGRVALVTGANSGLGLMTGLRLSQYGARVILAARTLERSQAAAHQIRLASPDAALTTAAGDLSTLAGVRALAAAVRSVHPQVDILVNNAGVVRAHRHETLDGLEWTFAVNHLAPFLLTRLLLPSLGPTGRVVIVTSDAHRDVSIDFDDLQMVSGYDPLVAYRRSKLANVLFAQTLARRAPGVSVVAVAPGIVATGIAREAPGPLQDAWAARGRPASQAAGTIVDAAADQPFGARAMRYVSEGRECAPSTESCDEELGDRLWDASAALTGTPAWPAALRE